MKKFTLYLLSALFLGMTMLTKTYAAVSPPLDQQGHALYTLDWVGAIPCNIDASTSTNAVLCGSTGAALGRNVVYGVIASTPLITNFLVLRDTSIANVTSATTTLVYAFSLNLSSTAQATPFTNYYKFPVPIRFLNGISANLATRAGNNEIWTILYRPLAAGE